MCLIIVTYEHIREYALVSASLKSDVAIACPIGMHKFNCTARVQMEFFVEVTTHINSTMG